MTSREILDCVLYGGDIEQMCIMPSESDVFEYAGGVIVSGKYDDTQDYLLHYTSGCELLTDFLADGRKIYAPDVVCTHDDGYILMYMIEP